MAYGGAGNDKIGGSVGFDEIYGGDGNDSIWTDEGGSKIDGGAGDDKLYGGNGLDEIQGGTGNDRIWGYEGDDQLDGGDGDDYLSGSDGNDTLIGGIGDDELYGGDGDDILNGGTGYDRLYGGDGDDTYIINSSTFYIYDSSGSDTAIVNVDFAKIPSFIENVLYADGVKPLPYWISSLLPDAGARISSFLGDERIFYFGFPEDVAAYGYDLSSEDTDNWQTFSAAQKSETRDIFAYIETLIDLDFVETEKFDQTTTMSLANNQQENSSGWAYYPSTSFFGSDIFFDIYSSGNLRIPTTGSSAADTFIHEIGHALGLKHPFDEPDADGDIGEPPYLQGAEDNADWTQMSYTGYRNVPEFSPLDIAALQYLYGVNPNSRSGDDTYTYSSYLPNFIWDGSGTDTIDASGSSNKVTIYLEPGYWGFLGEAKAEKITAAGQITINFGTLIENLLGSRYDDTLVGNSADNSISGGNGDDVLYGGDGNDKFDRESKSGDDTFYGGKGNDSYYFTTSYDGGTDTIVEELDEGIDTVHVDSSFSLQGIANVENLSSYLSINTGITLTGNELNNYIAPSDGSCVIDGKGGDDSVNYYSTWAKEQCTIQKEDGVLKVVKGNGSTDTLLNCEYIQFSDQLIVISSFLESVNNTPDGEAKILRSADNILSVDTSSIADNDGVGTFTFQWLANGQAVIGANEATYDLSARDVGKLIAVEVSYVDGYSTTETLASDSVSITESLNSAPSGKIKISGSLELGAVITPDTSALQDANGLGGFSYLWLNEQGEIVSRDLSLAITESVLGKSLQFKVSYTDGDLFEESVLSELITIPSDSNDVINLDIGGNTINGYDGLDQVVYGDNYEGVTVTKTSSGWEISSEAGTDTLEGVERLEFSDKKLALDIDGNAGAVAKLLGAFLGAEGVQITEYVTIGLEALDSGTSFEGLLQLALDTVFGSDTSGTELVSTFYQNLTGQTAPQDIIDTYATLIDSGSLTPLELATQVAEHPLNSENIDLIGLATTGLEYV